MLKLAAGIASATMVLSILAPIAASADSPSGTLVYHFTFSSNQNVSAKDSANPAEDYTGNAPQNSGAGALSQGSGSATYEGSLTDKGTITVNIVRQQPDGALVVMVSEQGENVRRAPPAECVVYGNTNVICDPNKTVYTEEYTLLRFLGGNFVDPNALDAKKHWQIVQDSPSLNVKADYTIDSNNSGIMQIGETRSLRNPKGGSLTTDIQAKIGYDFKRAVPLSVDEYTQQRHDNGVVGTTLTIYQTTLNLVSDSMAKT